MWEIGHLFATGHFVAKLSHGQMSYNGMYGKIWYTLQETLKTLNAKNFERCPKTLNDALKLWTIRKLVKICDYQKLSTISYSYSKFKKRYSDLDIFLSFLIRKSGFHQGSKPDGISEATVSVK